MRIRPSQGPAAPALPSIGAAAAQTDDAEFASTLADVRGADAARGADANERVRPLAERWGQYGRGAQPGGYGPPPDPALFEQSRTGAAFRASPLNPNGVTMDPPFVVPGYTGRGTPIPPGFFNIAYYNRYLEEGGTPLEGFPALEKGKSIMATYGTYGDGRVRATSFNPEVAETPDGGGTTGDAPAGGDVTNDDPACPCTCATASAAAPAIAGSDETAVANDTHAAEGAPVARRTKHAAASNGAPPDAATAAAEHVTDDPAPSAVAADGSALLDARLARVQTTFEAEIAALVEALLRG